MVSPLVIRLLFRGSPTDVARFIVTARVYPVYGVFIGRFFANLIKELLERIEEKLNASRTISKVFVIALLSASSLSHIVRVVLTSARHAVRASSKLLPVEATATTCVTLRDGNSPNDRSTPTVTRPKPLLYILEVLDSSKPSVPLPSYVYKSHSTIVTYVKLLLNYYGTILQNHGYEVKGLVVWHWYEGRWNRHPFKFEAVKEYVR